MTASTPSFCFGPCLDGILLSIGGVLDLLLLFFQRPDLLVEKLSGDISAHLLGEALLLLVELLLLLQAGKPDIPHTLDRLDLGVGAGVDGFALCLGRLLPSVVLDGSGRVQFFLLATNRLVNRIADAVLRLKFLLPGFGSGLDQFLLIWRAPFWSTIAAVAFIGGSLRNRPARFRATPWPSCARSRVGSRRER